MFPQGTQTSRQDVVTPVLLLHHYCGSTNTLTTEACLRLSQHTERETTCGPDEEFTCDAAQRPEGSDVAASSSSETRRQNVTESNH